eukprot:Hpha_TRINITY_DN10479_c0_g2::TRINITY_DN10479_c0_g2_i1::g.193341::m.193341
MFSMPVVLLAVAATTDPPTPSPTSSPAAGGAVQLAVMLEMFDQPSREKIGWVAGTPLAPCGWIGVACDGQKRVGSIILHGQGLAGGLSARLSELSQLEQLLLHDNQLSGPIPEFPASLAYANLGNNSFNGSIPALGGATNMLELTLASNSLVGSVPDGLSQLQYVKLLDLSHNGLTSLGPLGRPSGGVVLPMLTDLAVGWNKLSGTIPVGLEQLERLRRLDLSSNALTGTLPDGLGTKESLMVLLLATNKLNGVVPEMSGGNLSRVTLGGNKWECPLPNISERVWVDRAQTTCKRDPGGSGSHPYLLVALITLAFLYLACLLFLLRRLAIKRARARERAELLDSDADSVTDASTADVLWTHQPRSDRPSPVSQPQPATSRRPSLLESTSPGGGYHRRQGSFGRQGSQPLPVRRQDPTISVFGPAAGSMFADEARAEKAPSAEGSPYHQASTGRTMGLAAFPPYSQRAAGSPMGMFAPPVQVGYESLRVGSGRVGDR